MEYVILITLVVAAVVMMRKYVLRATWAGLKTWEEGINESLVAPAASTEGGCQPGDICDRTPEWQFVSSFPCVVIGANICPCVITCSGGVQPVLGSTCTPAPPPAGECVYCVTEIVGTMIIVNTYNYKCG